MHNNTSFISKVCQAANNWLQIHHQSDDHVQENVERPDDLYEGPQTSWLGYLSLAQRVDIADYADYIEQVIYYTRGEFPLNHFNATFSRTSPWSSQILMLILRSVPSVTGDSANIRFRTRIWDYVHPTHHI